MFLHIFFWMIALHALCDYPLQGPFLSEAKNRNTTIGKVFWPHALGAHAMIHGGAILMVTDSLLLATLEAVIHAATDWLKCEGRISLNVDQAVHVMCKVVWAAVFSMGLV